MVGVSRKELRGYYFHEVQTYIPRIQSDLAVLQTRADAMESIEEMHRLFHNIKGAASQVYLRHFSAVAELAEYLLNRAMRNGNHLSAASISYLVDTTNKIKEYSSAAHPDETDERALLLERYHQFIDLEELRNDAATVSLSEQMHNLLMMDPGSPGGNIATMHRGRKPSGESGTRKALVPMVARIGLLVEGMRTQPAEAAGYRRCLEEMEAAVQQIASIVREGGVTEETVFLRIWAPWWAGPERRRRLRRSRRWLSAGCCRCSACRPSRCCCGTWRRTAGKAMAVGRRSTGICRVCCCSILRRWKEFDPARSDRRVFGAADRGPDRPLPRAAGGIRRHCGRHRRGSGDGGTGSG